MESRFTNTTTPLIRWRNAWFAPVRTVEKYVGIIVDKGSYFIGKQQAVGGGGVNGILVLLAGAYWSLLASLEGKILLARGRNRNKENDRMRKKDRERDSDIGKRCCLTGLPRSKHRVGQWLVGCGSVLAQAAATAVWKWWKPLRKETGKSGTATTIQNYCEILLSPSILPTQLRLTQNEK